MSKIKDCTNAEVMFELIYASFGVYKSESKAASNRLDRAMKEMAKRLQISPEELEDIRNRL